MSLGVQSRLAAMALLHKGSRAHAGWSPGHPQAVASGSRSFSASGEGSRAWELGGAKGKIKRGGQVTNDITQCTRLARRGKEARPMELLAQYLAHSRC